MTTPSTNPSGSSFPRISKDRVLNTFKTPRNPIPTFHRLFDVFNEIFSKIPFEPENNLPPKEINPSELFVEAVATPKPMRLVTQKKIVIPKSPFTSSGYIEDPASRAWYYLDDSNAIQGPFTSMEMDHWFDNDYLSHELLIRLKEKNDFVKLINLFGKTEIVQTYKTGPYGAEQSPYPQALDSSDKKHSVYTFDAESDNRYAQSPYTLQKPQYSFDMADDSLQNQVLSPARIPTGGNKSALTPNQKSPAMWAMTNQGAGQFRNVNESPQSNKYSFGSHMANSPARK